jgi:hypothetical protein
MKTLLMASTDFKIKFDGEEHQLDANVLINSLIHTTTLVHEINRSIDPARKIQVKVRAPEKSSFLIQIQVVDVLDVLTTIKQFVTPANIETTSYIILSLVGLFEIKKHLLGSKPKEIDKSGDKTKIINKKGDVFYIDHAVFNIYEKNPTVQDALTQNFENINNEPSVTGFEILDENNNELFKVGREDFETLSVKDEVVREGERLRTETATLNIVRLSFEKGLTCDFYYKGHKIKAKIDDPTFQKRIDDGESFSKGDVLESELVIRQVWDESVQTFVNKGYSVSRIINHIRRDPNSQTKLFT